MQGTLYALFMHDAIYLYARLVNIMVGRGIDHRNGSAMFDLARTVEFTGIAFTLQQTNKQTYKQTNQQK